MCFYKSPFICFPAFWQLRPIYFCEQNRTKVGTFFWYFSSNNFPLFQKFPYIYSERAELGWKRAKMQIQEECNISHKLNAKWNVDRSRINCGITKKKNYYVFFCSKNLKKCNHSSNLRWVVGWCKHKFSFADTPVAAARFFPPTLMHHFASLLSYQPFSKFLQILIDFWLNMINLPDFSSTYELLQTAK